MPVDLRARRLQLRQQLTPAERALWKRLRRAPEGVKFRRQHPIGPYIADFFAASARLVVELDGGQHFDDVHLTRDAERTRYLESRGLRVVRFNNDEVLQREADVVDRIFAVVAAQLRSRPSP